ncbi:TetR/AcrR family transcriptional regulator [Phenylobacterium sp.]|uniref:TetR/AcrR family transcriptional regulator n=1 Tax=Phenylobacterium sp. TaxID=1871053 RepID=UPI00286AB88B|nr:TetR/AcrR family transcriptional regulator [Phenylobacterium sp.]
MAKQAERRIATRGAILSAAADLFGAHGFAATSVDQIAAAAGVAKGAIYHHFPTKESVFEAVFEDAAELLARDVMAASRGARDVLTSIGLGTAAYFEACSQGPNGRIILGDGPKVLGWERWREIDSRYFGAMIPRALAAAMDQGIIARQPVEPLGRLLLGAVTEAAVAGGHGGDSLAYVAALRTLLEGLRLPGTKT